MEFFDLKKQYQNLKPEIDAAVLKTLEGGAFIGGSEVENFENEVAEFMHAKYAVALNSGTDALVLAIKALGIGQGDEVIVPAFTYFATAEAVAAAGATPVFADIEEAGFNIDPAQIEKKITAKTKAMIPVHLFGEVAQMNRIIAVAQKYGLAVIEDVAQAAGARYGERSTGTIGNIGCFSLFPTKNLGAFGDGGFVITDNAVLAKKIKLLRAHGAEPQNKYHHLILGMNSRLDAIQAAIVRVKLMHLDEFNKKRILNARYYNDNLNNIGDIVLPELKEGAHVFHQYSIRTNHRDNLAAYLKKQGIPTMVYFPAPLHLQPALGYLNYRVGDMPQAERTSRQVLSLPVYPEFCREDQDTVIDAIKKYFSM